MKVVFKILGLLLLLLIVAYLIGPRVKVVAINAELPEINESLGSLDKYIASKEANFKIKPDNESRIIWANDSVKSKTEFVLLYLHGFSASWYEGNPVNLDFADRYNVNAYFPRLADHGLDTDVALLNMTPENLFNSAKEALQVARLLGDKIILMSTSTGGTLSLKLAEDFPELVHSLILLSPNVDMASGATKILTKPWGLQIGRAIIGGKNRVLTPKNEMQDQYGYFTYRVEGIIYLRFLVDNTMKPEVFKKVICPVFLGYYYKNEEEQDDVVRVDALLKMYDQLGTPENLKRKMAFPNAGDHVIGGKLNSNDYQGVRTEVFKFADEILKMN